MTTIEPRIVQTREGTKIEITSKWGDKRPVIIDREWDVFLSEQKIGEIRYVMITRERRGKGLRYVFARWRSPGWQHRSADARGSFSWMERSSRKACVESLVWQYEMKGK